MPSSHPIRIAKIAAYQGQTITIEGWVENRRSGGRVAFVEVRDGSASVQVVFSGDTLNEHLADRIRHLSRESSVRIQGEVHRDDRAASGFELHGLRMKVLHDAAPWPIEDRDADQRIDARHLYLRSRRMRAILKLRALLADRIRSSLRERGFTGVDAPIFTPNVVEERTTLFNAPGAAAIAYLSQSGQLYNEAAAMSLGSVYSFGPVFRSERTPTHRHLAEFWMVEPEIAFGTLETMITEAEALIDALLSAALHEGRPWLELLDRDIAALESCKAPFERISYETAIERIQAQGGKIAWGDDLDAEAEAILTRDLTQPIWVTGFPAAIKSFYMKRDPAQPDRVLAADLLAPHGVGEILGGGEREEDHDTLANNLNAFQLSPDAYDWYLALRRYGSVPHSGFGMGLERAMVWIAGLEHIDEAIPFPRLPLRSAP